ncbi:MAG: hypothetical protein IT300_02160 [Dehalococcoidia bacterium]|nr:hypothetical protein [Dehalococcoidia bacterium]
MSAFSPIFVFRRGHPLKRYSQPNTGAGGLALHSVEGYGLPERFWSEERVPGDPDRFTPYAAASAKFLLRQDPNAYHLQMSEISASDWTSGGREANTTTWSIEAEGVAGEPLTQHQIDGFFVIAEAWQSFAGRALEDGVTVRPHHQLAREYGYDPTACESNRYAEARRLFFGQPPPPEEPMNEDRIRELAQQEAGVVFLPLMQQLIGIAEETFTDDEALDRVRAALLVAANTNRRMATLEAAVARIGEAFGAIADGAVEAHAAATGES